MSAPATALRLSDGSRTPSSSLRVVALSPWSIVALTRFGENSPCLRYARRRTPPSFPAPRTASFWADRLRVMVPALLTTTLRGSKAQDDLGFEKRMELV